MPTDPRQLKPGELIRLINSTPLGEVLREPQLRLQRSRAGLRIGRGPTIDLLQYTAWLVAERHRPSPATPSSSSAPHDAQRLRDEAAQAAANVASSGGAGASKWERAIAALLTEPTALQAAEKAGISPSTLYRWLSQSDFRTAYDRARRELIAGVVARVQSSAGEAVEALATIARKSRRDGDRVRAASALLEHAWRGLMHVDLLRDPVEPLAGAAGHAEVVQVLTRRLRAVESTMLPASEKSRLTVSVADALLRALGVDLIDQRLAALESVLKHRPKEKSR
jgi:hypothetical protein